MAQPVIDTLRLSNALQEAGVERAQAEGVARTLGDEFSNHLVARGPFDAGFERVSGEFRDVHARFRDVGAEFTAVHARFREVDAEFKAVHARFHEVDAEFKAVRSEMAVMRSGMDSGFEVLRGSIEALDSKFRYMMAGIGLMLAFLSAIAGLAVFQRIPADAGLVPGAAWTAPEAPAAATTAPLHPASARPLSFRQPNSP